MTAYLQEHVGPDESIFDFSNQAAYLFFADRQPASRYFQVAYASRPSAQREVIAALETTAVPLIIFRCGTYYDRLDGIPTADRHPLIAEYLAEHYEPMTIIDDRVHVWRRRDR